MGTNSLSTWKVGLMCDKCRPRHKSWIHISDNWTLEEMVDMYEHLKLFVRQR